MSTSTVPPRTLPTLQRTRARSMRNNATPAERALWTQRRASRLGGHKFSRQIAIGPFICDLVCRQLRLIIELDGSQHGGPEDQARTRFLESQGYTVLRFWNAQVLEHLDSVLAVIEAQLRTMARAERTSPPTPPASGRGDERTPNTNGNGDARC